MEDSSSSCLEVSLSAEQSVKCLLCNAEFADSSRHFEFQVHRDCLHYSGVKTPATIRDLQREIRRGKLNPCLFCNYAGATVNCNYPNCPRAYHYPCYLKTGKLLLSCPVHYQAMLESSHNMTAIKTELDGKAGSHCGSDKDSGFDSTPPTPNNSDDCIDDELKPIRDLKAAGLSQMKSLFCKDIDPHLKRLKTKKRSMDRSPLSDKQTDPPSTSEKTRKKNISHGKENNTHDLSPKKKKMGRRSLSLNRTEKHQLKMIASPNRSPNKKVGSPPLGKKRKRSAVKLFQLSDFDDLPPVKILKRKSTDPNDTLTSPPKLELAPPPCKSNVHEDHPPKIDEIHSDDLFTKSRRCSTIAASLAAKNDLKQKSELKLQRKKMLKESKGKNNNQQQQKKKKKIVFNKMKRAFKNSLENKKKTDDKKVNKNKIKAFRKSPVKFDPSRVVRPDDDGIVPIKPVLIKKRKKSAIRKLNLDENSAFTPVNRTVKTIPGDYFSHGRQYFHVRNSSRISSNNEPEAEEDYEWIPDLMKRQIDEFLDLNKGEKEFFKYWNEFIIKNPAFGKSMLDSHLDSFVDQYGVRIASESLYRNFILHLTNLVEHECIPSSTLLRVVMRQQKLMATMNDKPWCNVWSKKIGKQTSESPPQMPIKRSQSPKIVRSKEEDLRLLREFEYEAGRIPRPSLSPIPPTIETADESSSKPSSKKVKKSLPPKTNNNSSSLRLSRRRSSKINLSAANDDTAAASAAANRVLVKYWGPGDYSSIIDSIDESSANHEKAIYTYSSPIRYKRKASEMISPEDSAKRRRTIKSPKLLDL